MHILQSEFKEKKNYDRKQGTIKFGKQVNMVKIIFVGEKGKICKGIHIPHRCPSSCTLQWIKNISFCTSIIWSLSHHWCCKSHDQFFFSICLLNNIKNLYQILKYKSFITFQRLPSFDYKCIAFYKFYTQTEANFYEKQDRSRPDLFDC